jgi:hypothetical protein
LTSALDGGEWSASRPGRFTPRERAPGTHWIGGWVGPRAVLDAVVKRKIPTSHWESNPRTSIVQPVAQHYTTWAIMAPCNREVSFISSAQNSLYGEIFFVPSLNYNLKGHPFIAVQDWLFNIFTKSLHIWWLSSPSSTWSQKQLSLFLYL